MRAIPRNFVIDIPVPIPVFQELCDFIDAAPKKQELSEVAGRAIHEWLESAAKAPVDRPSLLSGYQWKELFLPSGTVLRTSFKGRSFQATVQNDEIIYEGRAFSPSAFVNAVGGVGRNAWRTIWLLFPDEKLWRLAATCREALGYIPTRASRRAECKPG